MASPHRTATEAAPGHLTDTATQNQAGQPLSKIIPNNGDVHPRSQQECQTQM